MERDNNQVTNNYKLAKLLLKGKGSYELNLKGNINQIAGN
jgi:hypothetical protein